MAMPNQMPSVSPMITSSELAGRLRANSAPRIIDVREPQEFTYEHIPGSENIPLSSFNSQFQSLTADEEIVLVCRSGNRSGMAQRFLLSQGYTRTRNLIDGMLGWQGPTKSL